MTAHNMLRPQGQFGAEFGARFAGRCYLCGRKIQPGDLIRQVAGVTGRYACCATGQDGKQTRDRRPAWKLLQCDSCGQPAGSRCILTAADLASGMWPPEQHEAGSPRKKVHLARWQAYLAMIGPEGRRELAARQNRAAQAARAKRRARPSD
jgi:hypothetical protein